jgi:hypothetical protein
MSFLVELDLELYRPDAFAGFVPGPQYTPGNARAMMWMAQLAYETDHPDKIDAVLAMWKLAKAEILVRPLTSPLRLSHTRGVIARTATATIVAFAGTDPLSARDWLTDFKLGHPTGDIHAGFESAAGVAWDSVRRAIAEGAAAGRRLFFAGHSLGAAIVTATALRLLNDQALGVREAQVYGFGTPRALRPAMRELYNAALGPTTYRLIHGSDAVPSSPPSELGFTHVGRPLVCAHGAAFGDAQPSQSFDDIPAFKPQLIGGVAQFVHNPLDIPFPVRPSLGGVIYAALPPAVRDHIPDAYFHAIGTPLVAQR